MTRVSMRPMAIMASSESRNPLLSWPDIDI
jgi:hypothetical protein